MFLSSVTYGAAVAALFARGTVASTTYNIWACQDFNGPITVGSTAWTFNYAQAFPSVNPPTGAAGCAWHSAPNGPVIGDNGWDLLPPNSWTVTQGPGGEFLFYKQSPTEDYNKITPNNPMGTLTVYDTNGAFMSKQVGCKRQDPGNWGTGVFTDAQCSANSLCGKLVTCSYEPFAAAPSGTAGAAKPTGTASASSLVNGDKELRMPDAAGIEGYCTMAALLPQDKGTFEQVYPQGQIQAFFGSNHANGYAEVETGMLAIATSTADYSKNGLPALKALGPAVQTFAKSTVTNYQSVINLINNITAGGDIPAATAAQITPILQTMQKDAGTLNATAGGVFTTLRKFQTDTQTAVGGLKDAISVLEDPTNNGRKRKRDAISDALADGYTRSMRAAMTNIGRFCEMIGAALQVGTQSMEVVNAVLSDTIANLEGLERSLNYASGATAVGVDQVREEMTIAETEWQSVANASVGLSS